MLPIYWLLNMSFKTTNEILGAFTLWPQEFHARQLHQNLHRSDLVQRLFQLAHLRGDQHLISVTVALPAAYAFSRYRFLGDKHLFFWLLTNRMAPPAVFALPFFQLYSAVDLFDTHIAVALAHCLFNIPLAVWILEGFMSGVPKELDETAYVDGYPFWRFFIRIFMPTIAAGIGVAAFLLLHVLLGRVAARQDPDLGRRQADRGDHDPDRQHRGLRAGPAGGGGVLDHRPRRLRDLFRAQLHRQGLPTPNLWPGGAAGQAPTREPTIHGVAGRGRGPVRVPRQRNLHKTRRGG